MPRSALVANKAKASTRAAVPDLKSGPLLLRFRRDSPTGVTRNTLKRAATELGLNETQLVHMALREYIRRNLSDVDVNDPPITKADIEALRKKYPQTGHGRVLSSIDIPRRRKSRSK